MPNISQEFGKYGFPKPYKPDLSSIINPVEERYEKIKDTPEAWAAWGAPLVAGGYGLARGIAKSGLSPVKRISDVISGAKEKRLLEEVTSREKEQVGRLSNKLAESSAPSKFRAAEKSKRAPSYFESDVNKKAESILSDFYGTPEFRKHSGNEHSLLANAIKDNREKQIANLTKAYNKIFNEHGGRRTIGEGLKIRRFKNEEGLNEFSELKDSYDKFIKNPTVENAHWFQSKIGQGIRDLRKVDPAKMERSKIENLSKIQEDLRDRIVNNLPEKVGNKYKKITNLWKSEVTPYEQNRVINKASSGIPSENLAKQFTKRELDGKTSAVNTALRHMSPEQKRLIMANVVKESVPTIGDVKSKKLLESLQSAKSQGYGEFINPKDEENIRELSNKISRANTTKGLRAGYIKVEQKASAQKQADILEKEKSKFEEERRQISEKEKFKRDVLKMVAKLGAGGAAAGGGGLLLIDLLRKLGL